MKRLLWELLQLPGVNPAVRSHMCTLLLPQGCSLSTDNEIYLRNFLPELGNFTQALYRRLSTTVAN